MGLDSDDSFDLTLITLYLVIKNENLYNKLKGNNIIITPFIDSGNVSTFDSEATYPLQVNYL